MNNCLQLNNKIAHNLAWKQVTVKQAVTKKVPVLKYQKIMAPQTLEQSEGGKVCGSDQNDKTDYGKGMVGLMKKISSQQVSAQINIEVMQRSVAACPKVNMGSGRKRIPSLLDSGSLVTLICQSFFKQEILLHIQPSDGEKAEAHQLFSWQLPIMGNSQFQCMWN